MKINHKYDIYGRTEPSIIYLAKPGKRLYCALGGIDTSTASLSLKTNNTAELTFTVDKYINNTVTDGYEELDELMELYCDGIWFKIVDPPTINNDGLRETKEITAESYEIMLTQYKLKNFKINMGEEDSYEMMYQATHDTNKFYQIKFYDSENEDLSFLHLVLKHADVPGWHIGYVDNITPDDDGKLLPNNICNFEVDDQNVYAFLTQEAAQAYKCVFEFDTVNMTINVYRPDSLGKDTNVVLGFRNIQNSITISRDENLVTQFYVEGLDDYNIDAVNFGDSVITDLSYFICEPYMDTSLQEKYNAWQSYRESRREEFINLSKEYNKNLEVLTELMNRVPIDTAQTNWFGKKVEDLKDAYNANMAIIKGLEALYVDDEKNFDLEALKKSHDWPLYESIMNYTLPSIVAALQAQDETVEGFGKGNIISCVNPVVLGQDWYMVGSGTSSFQTVQINDAPAYGITRGVKVTGTDGGIYQHNISIEPSQRYTLSCFVKGSGTFYLGYNNTGEDRKNVAYNITSSWTRVYTSFNLSSRLIDVAFAGTNDFTICGMQLEMGDSPSQFGYFTQSENIIKAYETDWKLYGISELKVKISTYDSCIKELKKSGYADGYNPLSGYEEAYFTQMHQKYLDYLNLKDQAEAALKERQAEYDKAKKPEIQEKRNQIAKDVLLENFGKVQNKYSAFTDKETYIIKSLYSQTTYTNENIIVTTLDSTADAVDKSKVLYDDALEELYVESHPQYTYTDDVENVYALPEFKEYHEQLAVNDFVRVGITDTNYIKLRVIEITYNPCDLDESMEVTFSNMIQYKAKRNDYNTLLNDALNTSNRNGGRVNSVNKSSTSDYVITSEAIKQIFSNPLFNSMLGGTVTGGTGSGGTITADTIIAELVKAKEGVFDKLTVDTAFMKYLDVKLISADKITTRILEAEQANIEKLSAKIIESNQINADMINVKNLLAGHAGVGELHTIHLTVENAEIDQAVITNLIAKKIAVGDLMAQNALANQIVLISKDNKPTIAFQESTQQFYDSKGNVRVQIGMDGKGDFNFIVKNGDRAALFDENGITQTGIPDNTILGDMINNATITKDKLGFQIIEPNEQGGIDITNIYDGKGNQWWGIEKTTITDDYTKQIKNVTDTLTGQIETKVSNTQYLKDQESIRTDFSDIKQNVSGITSTVSSMQTDLSEAQEKIKANTSSITQNADKISFMVTGDKESEFTVTDKFIQMISDHISIDASTIDINGIITAMNTHTGPGKTKIDGGIIETNTITADSIKVDAIRSKIFEDDLTSNYSLKGIWFDLSENGAIKGKNFAVDSNGNAYIRGDSTVEGTIIANKGYIGGIGGFHIEAGKLYSGMDTFPEQPTSISKDKNVYIGTDGIALGSGNFRVDSNGKLYANSGTFSGTIYADGGTIGGWNISANSLSNRDGSISLNPDGLKLGNQLNIDNQGNATFGGKLSAATGSFSGELVAATGSFSGELKAARGSFKGELSGATGSFTGDITATSICAQDTYYIYNGTQTKNAKVIWCDTLTYEWNPSKDIIDFKIGTQDKAYLNFLTYTLNNHVNREASMYAVSSASVVSRVKCETGDTTSAVILESQSLSSYNIAAVQLRSTSNGCCLMPGNYDDSAYDEEINLGVSNNKWNQVFSKDLLFTGILSNARKNGVEFYDHGNTASTSAAISIRPIYNGTADEGSGKNSGSNVYSRVNLGTDKCHFRTLYVDRIVLGSDSTVHTTWGGSGGSSITSATASATSVSSSNSASASVDLSSDKKTLSFSFNIPRGKDGTNGKDGARGPRGYQGDPGPQGPPGEPGSSLSSGNYEVGMVTTAPRSFSPLRSTFHLGHAGNYRWEDVYAKNTTIQTSDEHLKDDIKYLDEQPDLEMLYMNLKPISYKLKNFDIEDHHDRIQIGFGARETETIMNNLGFDINDYSFLCKDKLDKPNKAGDLEEYSFRYGHIISLNTHMTQKAHHRIDDLEKSLTTALSTIETLKQEIETLKQAIA
nr:MAG TPA: Endo-N-acetylneuraminidase [Caudoviricetes sp.]